MSLQWAVYCLLQTLRSDTVSALASAAVSYCKSPTCFLTVSESSIRVVTVAEMTDIPVYLHVYLLKLDLFNVLLCSLPLPEKSISSHLCCDSWCVYELSELL